MEMNGDKYGRDYQAQTGNGGEQNPAEELYDHGGNPYEGSPYQSSQYSGNAYAGGYGSPQRDYYQQGYPQNGYYPQEGYQGGYPQGYPAGQEYGGYYPNPQEGYGTGRIPRVNAQDPYGTGRIPRQDGMDGYGTGRIPRQDGMDGYGTGRIPRQDGMDGYGTGRIPRQDGMDGYGTGRIPRQDGAEGYVTGRVPRAEQNVEYASINDYQRRADYRQPRPEDGAEDQAEGRETPRPAKKRKKKNKFVRILRGIVNYIASLPAKTLAIIGGVIAVLLVAIILLTTLLTGNKEERHVPSSGMLSIEDVTPTPSLPPASGGQQYASTELTPEFQETPEVFVNPLEGTTISKVGEENDVIPSVQERLVELGYMEMPSDGYTRRFGPATRTAVKLFQMKNFADYKNWDGILGPGTYELLMSDDARAYYLEKGDGNNQKNVQKLKDDVKALQEKLNRLGYLSEAASGVYNDATVAAVKLFQQYHGLNADGVAGQDTLAQIDAPDVMDAATGAIKLAPPAATDAGTAN